MRLFIATVTLWALASAKPEVYKEKEDFQFSRSSSDDGSKSGYYGAQRGNMGGNYERAHNMDSLAQHQMSTLVKQVDGELGEGGNTRTGSVFTAGNSRGVYGSGNYDLSNLKGRHFDESTSNDDRYSSSLMSQNSRNHAHLYSGINNAQHSGSQLDTSDLSSGYQIDRSGYGGLASQYTQAHDNQEAESQYQGSSKNYQYGGQGGSQYKYYSHGSSSQARNNFDQSASLQSNDNYNVNTRGKLISTIPHKIYLRPGTRVAIPIADQTYDASHNSLSQEQSAVNTDAEILNSDRNYVIRPMGTKPKHYESSYSYRKEWEKHDTHPIPIIPTENPFPKNSELYEDSQISGASGRQTQSEIDSTNIVISNLNSAQLSSLDSAQLSRLNSAHSSNLNSAHSSSLNSASSSGYSGSAKTAASNRLRYLSQMQNTAGLASSSDVHQANRQNLGESDLYSNLNLVDSNSRPKSYQSSYSYHKSWERRGDPYIIKPAESDISSQKLVADSANYGTHSHSQHGSHYSQSQDDCIEPGRYKRSYNTHQYPEDVFPKFNEHPETQEQFGQQSQNSWGDLESFGQYQNQMGQLEDLGQQSQNSWGNLESFDQGKTQIGQLDDLGQQTQNLWGDKESFGQHNNKIEKLDDLGQQKQSLGDYSENLDHPSAKLDDLSQQTQNTWGHLDNLDQHIQHQIEKLEDLGQETQNTWDHSGDFGQQTQNKEDNVEKLDRDHIETLGQQVTKLHDLGQETQNSWGLDNFHPQSQSQIEQLSNFGQETQNIWDHNDNIRHQYQSQVGKLEDLGQQTQNLWGLENFNQQSHSQTEQLGNMGQEAQNIWDNIDIFTHPDQNQIGKIENLGQQTQTLQIGELGKENLDNLGKQTQLNWNNMENQKTQSEFEEIEKFAPQSQSKWHTSEFDGQVSNNEWSNTEKLVPQTESKPHDEQSSNQQTQNGWNQIEDANSSSGPQATRDLEKTPQNINEIGKLSTSTQEHVNLWNNIHNFDMQQHNDGSSNINQEVQNIFWHKQDNNEQAFEQHNFDSWHHQTNGDKSISQESGNNKETLLWDMIDKLIEESDKKDKNKSLIHNSEHSLNSYNNEKQGETTVKSIIKTTQPYVNNENIFEESDFTRNIGRGDIGPEDIQSSNESNEKSEESNLPKNSSQVNNYINTEKESYSDKPKILNVTVIEDQKLVTTSTSKPKRQHRINDLNTQFFPEEYVPQNTSYSLLSSTSEPKNEYQDNYQHATLDNIEQQNLEQQYEHLERTSMNDKSLLDFSQQAQIPRNDNEEIFSQSNFNQLEVQKHVRRPVETQKLDNFDTRSKMISDKVEQATEVTTENSGFWKSVWGKTVNTKDKVVSWFKN